MTEKKTLKKSDKVKIGLIAFCAIAGAGHFFFSDSVSPATAQSTVAIVEPGIPVEPVGPVEISEPLVHVVAEPRSTQVHDSVESLAQAYVSGSLDENEARAFLVKVRSARIARQDRLIQEERLASARFQAEIAEHELALERSKQQRNELLVPNTTSRPVQFISEPPVESRSRQPTVDLNEYRLLSISRHQGAYQVRMVFRGTQFQALEGQQVVGGATVEGITQSDVTLQLGSSQRILQGLPVR